MTLRDGFDPPGLLVCIVLCTPVTGAGPSNAADFCPEKSTGEKSLLFREWGVLSGFGHAQIAEGGSDTSFLVFHAGMDPGEWLPAAGRAGGLLTL